MCRPVSGNLACDLAGKHSQADDREGLPILFVLLDGEECLGLWQPAAATSVVAEGSQFPARIRLPGRLCSRVSLEGRLEETAGVLASFCCLCGADVRYHSAQSLTRACVCLLVSSAAVRYRRRSARGRRGEPPNSDDRVDRDRAYRDHRQWLFLHLPAAVAATPGPVRQRCGGGA